MYMRYKDMILNKICWHFWAAENQAGSAHSPSPQAITIFEEANVVAGLGPTSSKQAIT